MQHARSSLLLLCLSCEVHDIHREAPPPKKEETTIETALTPAERPAPCVLTGEQRLSLSLWQDGAQVTIQDAVAKLRPAPFSLWLCFRQDSDVAVNASLSDELLQHASHGGVLFSPSDCCQECDARCNIPVGRGGLLGPFDGTRTFAHNLFHSGRDILLADDSVNGYYYSAPDDYDFNEVKVQDGVVTGRVDIDVFWEVQPSDTQPNNKPLASLAGRSLYLVFMARLWSTTTERQRDWVTLKFSER